MNGIRTLTQDWIPSSHFLGQCSLCTCCAELVLGEN